VTSSVFILIAMNATDDAANLTRTGAGHDLGNELRLETEADLGTEGHGAARKIVCRYGRGCTHQDPSHKERFWHPPVPEISDEQIRTHYICNECGLAKPTVQDLQIHLQGKAAWSNNSLVGCRVNCLIDCKEWHEGFVTMYHRSGKHYVEFRHLGEKLWLDMKKGGSLI